MYRVDVLTALCVRVQMVCNDNVLEESVNCFSALRSSQKVAVNCDDEHNKRISCSFIGYSLWTLLSICTLSFLPPTVVAIVTAL